MTMSPYLLSGVIILCFIDQAQIHLSWTKNLLLVFHIWEYWGLGKMRVRFRTDNTTRVGVVGFGISITQCITKCDNFSIFIVRSCDNCLYPGLIKLNYNCPRLGN